MPSAFDLRNVNGTNFTTSVKNQQGGTCWTFGTMAALESNLKMTGKWQAENESGEPNLAEYHLDWWNGFNKHNNDDATPPTGGGLTVHQGGDYLVAAAYFARGEGAVRDIDGQSYDTAPSRASNSFHYYFPNEIIWYKNNDSLYNTSVIKQAIMKHGAISSCVYWNGSFFSSANGGTFYQPSSDNNEPNHSIAIIGWDDEKITQAPTNGAWLCKNSWGNTWNGDGYFWISYFDKHCAKHPEMGAVSFRDVHKRDFYNAYYYDYHGWRDTFPSNTALNIFYAKCSEIISAVSFYTATNDVEFSLKIYSTFTNNCLTGELISQTGAYAFAGFHTLSLYNKIPVVSAQQFCVSLNLSRGGQPYDRTSEISVLMRKNKDDPEFNFDNYLQSVRQTLGDKITVESKAGGGESFFWNSEEWIDFTNINSTANFCIKALSVPIPEPPETKIALFIFIFLFKRLFGIICDSNKK